MIRDYSCVQDDVPNEFDYTGIGNIDENPLFVRAPAPGAGGPEAVMEAYGLVRLQSHSPCIDMVDAALVAAEGTDIDGFTRVFNCDVDLGAHEAPGSLCGMPFPSDSGILTELTSTRGHLQFSQAFGPGDFPPRSSDVASSSSPLVSKESSYFRGPNLRPERPVHHDVIDMITGKPLLQEVDFELPFGGAVFRHVRTYGESVTDHGLHEWHDQGAMWDWNGVHWMMSENPIFLIDGHFPFVNYEETPRCYFIPDAHHAIPFLFDEALGEYVAPAWFDAILGHNGAYDAATTTWIERPTEFYVRMYHGTVKYTIRAYYDTLEAGPRELAYSHHTPVCDPDHSSYSDFQGACADPMQRAEDVTSASDQYQGGVPHYGLVQKIEDRYGNSIEYEYCTQRSYDERILRDWCGYADWYCVTCENCLERGQINAIRLRAAPSEGETLGKVIWTLAYTYRNFREFDESVNPVDYLEYTMLHSIHVYEGEAPIPDACRTIDDAYFTDAESLDAIDAIGPTNQRSSGIHPALPDYWVMKTQYMYTSEYRHAPYNFANVISLADAADGGTIDGWGWLAKAVVTRKTREPTTLDESFDKQFRLYRYQRTANGYWAQTYPGVIASNLYVIKAVYEPETIESIRQAKRFQGQTFSINELVEIGDDTDVQYFDSSRTECITCFNGDDPSAPCRQDCADAFGSADFCDLADLEFEERTSATDSQGDALASEIELALPDPNSAFRILRTGKFQFIDRRADRDDRGHMYIYNGFIQRYTEEPSPQARIDQKDPGIYHAPFRYWDSVDGGYQQLNPTESFWVTIVDERPFVEPTAGTDWLADKPNRKRRAVEMNAAGLPLFDRYWEWRDDGSGGTTNDFQLTSQEGFAETAEYDPWGYGKVLKRKSKGWNVANDPEIQANPDTEGLVYVFRYEGQTSCEQQQGCDLGELAAIGIQQGNGLDRPVRYIRSFERGVLNRQDLITRECAYPAPVSVEDLGTSGDCVDNSYCFKDRTGGMDCMTYPLVPEDPIVAHTVVSPQTLWSGAGPEVFYAVGKRQFDDQGNLVYEGAGSCADTEATNCREFFFNSYEYDDKGQIIKQVIDAPEPAEGFARVASDEALQPALGLTTLHKYDPSFGRIWTKHPDGSEEHTVYIDDPVAGSLEQWLYRDVRTDEGFDPQSPVQITVSFR